MLGYVVTYKPEMKVKEAELYKAYYCGVCKSIGRRYGQLPRFVLSYDAAFLAVVLDCLYEDGEELSREACIANPFKKKAVASAEAIDFAADVMLILAWFKLADDAKDEGKKQAEVLTRLMGGKYRRLKKARWSLCERIEENLHSLTKLEDEKCSSIDMAAEAFAKIMESIFTEGLYAIRQNKRQDNKYTDDKSTDGESANSKSIDIRSAKVILSRIGYHLGKWIYLMDAYDDIDENIQSGAYNPLIYRFEYKKEENPLEFRKRIRETVERNLILYLSEIAKAFDLLDIKKNKGIIENIVYVGLLKKTEEVLSKGETDNEQSI